jgi:hypothetical protein
LIAIEVHPISREVDNVCRTRAIDVGQADPLVVKPVGVVEPWRVVHDNLGAEAPKPEVWPVADAAVADADEVAGAVSTHVSKVYRLLRVGKDDCRSTLFVPRLADTAGRAKPHMSGRLVPRQGIMLRHKHVRNAITVEIYESEIGVSPVDVGQGPEGKERVPPTVTCALVKARYGSVELNNVQPAVAIKVEELDIVVAA